MQRHAINNILNADNIVALMCVASSDIEKKSCLELGSFFLLQIDVTAAAAEQNNDRVLCALHRCAQVFAPEGGLVFLPSAGGGLLGGPI